MYAVDLGDVGNPTKYPGGRGAFTNPLPLTAGVMAVINDSPYQLRFQLGTDGPYTVPPTSPRVIVFTPPAGIISWSITNTLAASSPPISDVMCEIYERSESVGPLPFALVRQANVGNVVSTTGTSVVINDGNPAPAVVVEGTPQGAGSSQLKLNNDGSAILGGGALTISNAGAISKVVQIAWSAALSSGTKIMDL